MGAGLHQGIMHGTWPPLPPSLPISSMVGCTRCATSLLDSLMAACTTTTPPAASLHGRAATNALTTMQSLTWRPRWHLRRSPQSAAGSRPARPTRSRTAALCATTSRAGCRRLR